MPQEASSTTGKLIKETKYNNKEGSPHMKDLSKLTEYMSTRPGKRTIIAQRNFSVRK